MKRIALFITFCLFSTVTASAQQQERVIYKKRTVIDLDGVPIEGTRELPHEGYVSVPRRPHFKTMVKVRGTFLPELQKSADNL